MNLDDLVRYLLEAAETLDQAQPFALKNEPLFKKFINDAWNCGI